MWICQCLQYYTSKHNNDNELDNWFYCLQWTRKKGKFTFTSFVYSYVPTSLCTVHEVKRHLEHVCVHTCQAILGSDHKIMIVGP